MPNSHKEPYAGSCNPSRRAKRLRSGPMPSTHVEITSSSTSNGLQSRIPLPILPKAPSNSAKPDIDIVRSGTSTVSQVAVAAPTKRGRKPGSGSRAAKEAQRKLNHSIIEKVRRTKINDALATLRRLVPADYTHLQNHSMHDDDDDDDERDGEYEERSKKANGTGKKEKEKEFKLEILVRTVSFLQDLLERVTVLERDGHRCTDCGNRGPSSVRGVKRKRDQRGESSGVGGNRLDERTDGPVHNSDSDRHTGNNGQPSPNLNRSSTSSRPYFEHPLPSISSWLPDPQIDPSLLSPSQILISSSRDTLSHLPSPPSSTNFHPVRTSQFPPALTLSPVAACHASPPTRTPEDESAASLLLQISTSSPTFLPSTSSTSSCPPFELSASEPRLSSMGRHSGPSRLTQALTPSSLLGMTQTRVV